MSAFLELQGVACGYPKGFSLGPLSLCVEKGTVLGVIGPNGSGKTTLVRVISRVLRPHRGEALLEGVNIWELSSKEFACRVAVVSQELPRVQMRIEEYVMLGRLPHYNRFQLFEKGSDRQVVEYAMRLVGVEGLRERLLERISGGERQLVGMARAVAQEPELLVLDEPVAHLDISKQLEVLGLVHRLRDELGLTVVVVLHDMNLAAEFCDLVGVMKDGRLVAMGEPWEIITEEMVLEVYGARVRVERNRFSGRPLVVVSREALG